MNRTFSTFRKRREEKYGAPDLASTDPQNRLDRRPMGSQPEAQVPNAESTEDATPDTAAPAPAPAPAPTTRPETTGSETTGSEAPAAPVVDSNDDSSDERTLADSELTEPIAITPAADAEVDADADADADAQYEDETASAPEFESEAETRFEPQGEPRPEEESRFEDESRFADEPEITEAELAAAAADFDAPEDNTDPAAELPGPAAETPETDTPEVGVSGVGASGVEVSGVEVSGEPAPVADATVVPATRRPVAFSDAETTRFAAIRPDPIDPLATPVAAAGSPADDNETERFTSGSEAATERINIGKSAPAAAPVAARPTESNTPAIGKWKAEPAAPQYIPARGADPKAKSTAGRPKRSRKGLWTSIVALVAIIAAAVVIALLASGGEDSEAPADVAADRAIEYVTALRDGNIVVLRSITCGEAQQRFTTVSDQEFAEDHRIQQSNNELVGIDGVKASKIVNDGDGAVVEVIAYKTGTPDEKLDVALTLSKIDGEWKVCKS